MNIQSITITSIPFNQLMSLIQEKYGWDYRDMSQVFNGPTGKGHFDRWCDQKGYGEIDPDGKHRGSSQIWYAEYESSPDGASSCPPYQDVWHWLIENPFADICNGSHQSLSIEWLTDPDTPDYVKVVLQAIFDEVKDHPAFDGSKVNFYISW